MGGFSEVFDSEGRVEGSPRPEDAEITQLRTCIKELEAEIEEDGEAMFKALARASSAEARVKELEAQVQRFRDCNNVVSAGYGTERVRAEQAEAKIERLKDGALKMSDMWGERADKAEAALAESQARVAVLMDALDAEMGSCGDARDQHDCQLCDQAQCPMRDAFFAEAVKARRA